jgi:hypothetical protein
LGKRSWFRVQTYTSTHSASLTLLTSACQAWNELKWSRSYIYHHHWSLRDNHPIVNVLFFSSVWNRRTNRTRCPWCIQYIDTTWGRLEWYYSHLNVSSTMPRI